MSDSLQVSNISDYYFEGLSVVGLGAGTVSFRLGGCGDGFYGKWLEFWSFYS